MKQNRHSQSLGFRGVAIIAAAMGAAAVGAFAIGAFAIGRLAIGRISVGRAKFKCLEIDELTVTRLHAAEITVSDSLKLPTGDLALPESPGPRRRKPRLTPEES